MTSPYDIAFHNSGWSGASNPGGSLGQRLNDHHINVKRDFGAKGDNSTDDYAAIQAALNVAFGTAASPHGNTTPVLNLPVFFPQGEYKILTPLSITAAWGGKLFGAGQNASIISYQGSITPVNSENFCPTLWLNGCNFVNFSDLSFQNVSDATNHETCCLWFGPDGVNGGSSAHGNTLTNVGFSTASYGVIHGSTNSAANSENTYVGCNFSNHESVGLFLSGANTLNMRVLGGSFGSCGIGLQTNNAATCPVIANCALDSNTTDFNFASSGYSVISGCRSESFSFVKTSAYTTLLNCDQAAAPFSGTGTSSGTTLTITAVSSGSLKPGMIAFANDGTHSLVIGGSPPNTTIVSQLTGAAGGIGTYQLSIAATPSGLTSTTITGVANFLTCIGQASVFLENCGSAFDVGFLSTSGSQVRIRGNQFQQIPGNLLRGFSGKILEYDVQVLDSFIVSTLPAASASFKGTRMFVTDSTVAGSGNFGATVSGTGSNAVPVYCDGTNWKIG